MAVDVPEFIRRNAARGLEYNREGKGGEGLVEQTLSDARDMVRGSISEAKVRKMRPWFARHKVDMDAPANDPDNDAFPGNGAVAWLLWGGSVSGDKMDAAKWAERVVERLDREQAEAASLDSVPRVEIKMDTIEGQLANALSGIAAKEVEVTEARAVAEKAVAEKLELDGKVAELTASVATLSAEKAELVAKVAALEAASVSASEEAAKIAASVGVEPVESAPAVAPVATADDIRAQFLAMPFGVERTAFFNKNKKAILGTR
jgi:hypothetical protein